jgi:hypothetical protein
LKKSSITETHNFDFKKLTISEIFSFETALLSNKFKIIKVAPEFQSRFRELFLLIAQRFQCDFELRYIVFFNENNIGI